MTEELWKERELLRALGEARDSMTVWEICGATQLGLNTICLLLEDLQRRRMLECSLEQRQPGYREQRVYRLKNGSNA